MSICRLGERQVCCLVTLVLVEFFLRIRLHFIDVLNLTIMSFSNSVPPDSEHCVPSLLVCILC